MKPRNLWHFKKMGIAIEHLSNFRVYTTSLAERGTPITGMQVEAKFLFQEYINGEWIDRNEVTCKINCDYYGNIW